MTANLKYVPLPISAAFPHRNRWRTVLLTFDLASLDHCESADSDSVDTARGSTIVGSLLAEVPGAALLRMSTILRDDQ